METRRMCPHCRAFITTKDRVCPYCNETVGPRAVDRSDPAALLGGFIPHARFVTMLILVINFGIYAATSVYSMRSGAGDFWNIDGRTLFIFGGKIRVAVLAGQWWRLVTAGFLHGGMLHILMNSWVLFDLGAQVEEIYGPWRLIVIYFASTVFGFVASTWWSPVLSVGASAGLFGLIGAMIALGVMHQTPLGSAIRGMYVRWAIYGLLFGLLPGLRVDNAAHIGGLAAGFAAAWIAGLPRLVAGWRDSFWKAAAIACLALTAISFIKMYAWFATTSL